MRGMMLSWGCEVVAVASAAEAGLRLADFRRPPDLIGLNYYLTSDRFLDHRLELYPRELWGGNGRERYADVDVVATVEERQSGRRILGSRDRKRAVHANRGCWP